MELDDFITLATPEGVELELSLAGAGSRLIAGAVDMAVKGVLLVACAVGLAAVGDFGVPVFSIVVFLLLFAYDIPFEVLGRGRTPGKRMSGLRVVRSDGSPVDLRSSAVRNIARLIDGPTLFYIPTVVGILATKNNQRPGDLAGDTVVIRVPGRTRRGRRRVTPPTPAAAAADWDVSAISAEEIAVVRRFIERRATLGRDARLALAVRLAEGLRPRVGGAPAGQPAERFLETLLATKAARTGLLAPPLRPS
ncbi:MAG: RDD family protein [Actinobacteria bacterium]|nr:RDD family protein [Actinomycetota bacterium]